VRRELLSVLRGLAREAAQELAGILLGWDDPDDDGSRWANIAGALRAIGPGDREAALLEENLRDGDALARENAARAIGDLGIRGRAILAALTEALGDPEWAVREN
jgi:HEAT repeat protein